MPVYLTDKVAPLNDAFTGMVDANQVLGGGDSGTLPDDCVAESNVTQHQTAITELGTITIGTWHGSTLDIGYGGTGQTTRQAAINALTNVSAATDEYVLTKDTATGDAIWKAASGGGGGGEANTASSAGTGTSLFYQKSGVDLQFNGIKSENTLLTVALDSGSHDVELTVNESNINHDALSGFVSAEHENHSTWAGSTSLTTLGTITIGTWHGGAVDISYGGTGETTQQAAINALTNVSAATDEYVLTKDTATGNALWKAPSGGGGGGSHTMLSATHTDSVANTVSRGSLIYGNSTPAWDELTIGAANSILTSDGTDVSWSTTPTVTTLTNTAGINSFTSSTFSGPIRPAVDNTTNLGNTGYRWKELYTSETHYAGSVSLTVLGDQQKVCIQQKFTDASRASYGMFAWAGMEPDASSSKENCGVGGYVSPVGTSNWTTGSKVKGLRFGPYCGPTGIGGWGDGGSALYLKSYGIETWGANNYNQAFYALETYGLFTTILSRYGASLTAKTAYGIYIDQGSSYGAGTLTCDYMYCLWVEKPTLGTTNEQVVLDGTDTGSGIWFGGASGKRIYNDGTSFRITGLSTGSGSYYLKIDKSSYTDRITYQTSSLRYKKNVKTFSDDWNKILSVRPVSYIEKDDESNRVRIGYIAEELDKLGLNFLVAYDKEGRPDGVDYPMVSYYLLEVIKNQEARLNKLEEKVYGTN